ncbi:MAG: FeoB small GTPase domain-containing protein, partial [Methylophilaceae bacterium]
MKRIALLGMPNTGKSTLFNRLSGASAKVGNWPGITVNLMSAKILLGGHIAELVDLPGIYDLHGFSDDEHVVRHFLSNHPIDLLMVVANSTQIDRQLSLVLQLRQLGLPAILLLNMRDEAKRLGIHIQTATMAEKLNIPVIEISAKYGDQCNEALKIAAQALQSSLPVSQAHVAEVLASDMSIEQEMESIIESSVDYPSRLNDEMTTRLDNILLHPWLGM